MKSKIQEKFLLLDSNFRMDSQDFQSKYSNFNFKRQHKGEIRVD